MLILSVNFSNSKLLLSGHFNKLSNDDFCDNGLISLVKEPTRGQNCLDRIYSNLPITCRIKVVKSLVKSDHLGIVLSDADDAVATFIKTKKTVTFRR